MEVSTTAADFTKRKTAMLNNETIDWIIVTKIATQTPVEVSATATDFTGRRKAMLDIKTIDWLIVAKIAMQT